MQKFAREFATLDRFSNGRVVLGVGLGVPADAEFEAFGEDGDDPAARATARRVARRASRSCGRASAVAYDGDTLHVHTAPLIPTPVQQPRVPIWVAATWPGAPGPLRRAARWDGVFPIPHDPMNDVHHRRRRRRDPRRGRARPTASTSSSTAGPDADPAAFARAGVTWWIETYFTRDDALQRARKVPAAT